MGVVNSGLIPAAILYENPGITKEKFSKLLNKVQIKSVPNIDVDDDYEGFGELSESHNTNRGVFGLSKILGLKSNIKWNTWAPSFEEFERYGERRLGLHIIPKSNSKKFFEPVYQVANFVGYDEDKGNKNRDVCWKPKIQYYNDLGKRIKVFDFEKIGEKVDSFGGTHPLYNIKYVSFTPKFNVETYFSLEKLIKSHSELNPNTQIDWSKPEGRFFMEFSTRNDSARWIQRDGKYYLKDPLKMSEHQYTSMILTSDVIKNEDWKMLGFHGYDFTEKYLAENPKVDINHKQAIYDYNTNKARSRKISNTEFMRERICASSFNKFKSTEDKYILHNLFSEERGHSQYSEMRRFRTDIKESNEPAGPGRIRSYPPQSVHDLHLDLVKHHQNMERFGEGVPEYMDKLYKEFRYPFGLPFEE